MVGLCGTFGASSAVVVGAKVARLAAAGAAAVNDGLGLADGHISWIRFGVEAGDVDDSDRAWEAQ